MLDAVLASRDRQIAELAAAARVVAGAEGDRDGELVVIDLLDHPAAASPGFLGYALYPECRYTISAVRAHGAIKIAVGHNPWVAAPRAHDVGALCERLGGGGHAVVGGVTLGATETARARATIEALVAALRLPAP